MANNANVFRQCAQVLGHCADIADAQGIEVAIGHAMAPALGQIQQQLLQMQQQMQQMQQDVAAIRQSSARLEWNSANRRIRQLNDANNDLRPLHKERAGGEYHPGDLPPPELNFPQTRAALMTLPAAALNQWQSFYGENFGGANIGVRREAFQEFLTKG